LTDHSKLLDLVALDPRFVPETATLLAITSRGRVTRLPLALLRDLAGKTGKRYVRLVEDERVVQVLVVRDERRLILASAGGQVLQLPLSQIPVQEKAGKGMDALTLPRGDLCLGGGLDAADVVTTAGRTHNLAAAKLRVGKPGDSGEPIGPRTRLAHVARPAPQLIDWNALASEKQK
jgi:DNA gyrase/topoisomerase IV subunit A